MTDIKVDQITDSAYQSNLQEDKIAGSNCPKCNSTFLPPRAICPRCNNEEMQWEFLDGNGKLAAFTFVNIVNSSMAAEGYGRDNPNCSGIVELEQGVKIAAQIVGIDNSRKEKVFIGMPLSVKFLHQNTEDSLKTFLAFVPNK